MNFKEDAVPTSTENRCLFVGFQVQVLEGRDCLLLSLNKADVHHLGFRAGGLNGWGLVGCKAIETAEALLPRASSSIFSEPNTHKQTCMHSKAGQGPKAYNMSPRSLKYCRSLNICRYRSLRLVS